MTAPPADAFSVAVQLESSGFTLFELPDDISNRQTFVDAVRTSLPLDPALGPNLNWDGLTDSVFGGLMSTKAAEIVILWPDGSLMRETDPDEFGKAVESLLDAANAAARQGELWGRPVDARIVVGLTP